LNLSFFVMALRGGSQIKSKTDVKLNVLQLRKPNIIITLGDMARWLEIRGPKISLLELATCVLDQLDPFEGLYENNL
jgi:hypothetical protein